MRVRAEMPTPKSRVSTVHEHKRRTPSQRGAALTTRGTIAAAVLTAYDYKVDGRSIGDIRWGELQSLCRQKLSNGASYLRLGTEEIAHFLVLEKIVRHGQAVDHSMKTRDAVSARVLQGFIDDSILEAPRYVGMAMQAAIDTVAQESQRKALS
jgi:hypothetical protein